MWQKVPNIHRANAAKSFRRYLHFMMSYCLTTETHSQPQTERAYGMILISFVIEQPRNILQHVPEF